MGRDYVYCILENGEIFELYKNEKHRDADIESLEQRFPGRLFRKQKKEIMKEPVWENEDK